MSTAHKSGWDRRKAEEERATPKWADKKAIKRVYKFASRHGLHVDHIVPLNHPLVCGLHCEANLNPVPPYVNLSKSNFTWPDKWFEQMELIESEHVVQLSLFN